MEYRLIKEYPGSPKLDSIHGWGKNSTEDWLGTDFYNKYPEFWEKVEEKTYEILSFKFLSSGCIAVLRTNGNYLDQDLRLGWYNGGCNIGATLDYMLNIVKGDNANCVINSVKRLSDSEVFTLGDTAQTVGKYPHTIISMEIRQKNKDGERGVYDGTDRIWLNWEGDAGGNWLENVEKAKQPLFQTNDGVDIYKGDIVYFVNDKWKIVAHTVHNYTIFLPYVEKNSFSTKEKAEQWILWDKPSISLNNVYQTMLSSCYADILDNLKEILKSRL